MMLGIWYALFVINQIYLVGTAAQGHGLVIPFFLSFFLVAIHPKS